jgi:hypothetical protein
MPLPLKNGIRISDGEIERNQCAFNIRCLTKRVSNDAFGKPVRYCSRRNPDMSFAISPAQSPGAFRVAVQVSDTTGAGIPDARVTISPADALLSDKSDPIALKTNSQGIVTARLNSGTYVLSVGSPGFNYLRQQIAIQKSTSLKVTLEIAQSASPRNIKEERDLFTPTSPQLHELIPELSNAQHP